MLGMKKGHLYFTVSHKPGTKVYFLPLLKGFCDLSTELSKFSNVFEYIVVKYPDIFYS